MLSLTRLVGRILSNASRHFGKREPEHLVTARRGEMEAYFHLRKQGYRIVAKKFRTPHNRGEIDLIGWDDGVLCFVEVKTHAQPGLVPPEMAVDIAKKQTHLVGREALRAAPARRTSLPCRFDIVSVVLGDDRCKPAIRLYKGAFSWKSSRHWEREPSSRHDRKRWWRR